jgi:hypothetical protein
MVGKPQKSKHKNPMVLVIFKNLKEEEEEEEEEAMLFMKESTPQKN